MPSGSILWLDGTLLQRGANVIIFRDRRVLIPNKKTGDGFEFDGGDFRLRMDGTMTTRDGEAYTAFGKITDVLPDGSFKCSSLGIDEARGTADSAYVLEVEKSLLQDEFSALQTKCDTEAKTAGAQCERNISELRDGSGVGHRPTQRPTPVVTCDPPGTGSRRPFKDG